MTSYSKPSKLAIAESFSKAASRYDQSAELQRRIGEQLLQYLPNNLTVSNILDLGCGTGYFSQRLTQHFQVAHLLGVDIAEGMIKQASSVVKGCYWLVADAEQLPIASHSMDLIFSNLALQWCHDFSKVLLEAYRILKPKGCFIFTSLGEGTLTELQQSWQAVDNYSHVNQFLPVSYYQQLLVNSQFTSLVTQCSLIQSFYPDLKGLMQDLKGIGAHNMNPQRNKGLTSRRQWQTLTKTYEKFRTTQGLPASYQVIYTVLSKE